MYSLNGFQFHVSDEKKYALRYGQSLKPLTILLGMQVIHTKETPMWLLYQIILRTIHIQHIIS